MLSLRRNQIGDAGMTAFSNALGNGSLRSLDILDLDNNQIGDVGMVEFSRQITIGSLRHLTELHLAFNQISDTGMVSFANAIKPTPENPMGSLPACATILVEDGNPGNTAPLEAACEERGIVCM